MQLYAFCTPCLQLEQLAGAFLTLRSLSTDLQPSCGPLTLDLQAAEGTETVVLLSPDGDDRCMVLALAAGLEEALQPLSQQLKAFLIALRGSLLAAFREKERMDALCRRLAAIVQLQPSWELLQLLQTAADFCPLQDVVRAKLQATVVHLEAGFDVQPKALGTCSFLGPKLLFSDLSEEHLQFVLRFLLFHVFFAKRPAQELLQERFKTPADKQLLALQVVRSGPLCLCAIMTSAEEEPAVEMAHQLRACLREIEALVQVSANKRAAKCHFYLINFTVIPMHVSYSGA